MLALDHSDEAKRVAEALCEADEHVESEVLVLRIKALQPAPAWRSTVIHSIEMARRAHGIGAWSQAELLALCSKKANIQRGYGYSHQRGIRVMTIQAAKNRQFRDVVVLLGPGIPGTADHQRRLLYNAVSRAECNCTVMVRTQQLLQHLPFV